MTIFFFSSGHPDHSKTHKDKEIVISLLQIIAKAAQPEFLLQGEVERIPPFLQKNVGQDTFFLSKKKKQGLSFPLSSGVAGFIWKSFLSCAASRPQPCDLPVL